MFGFIVLAIAWVYWSYKSLKDLWEAYKKYRSWGGKYPFPSHHLKKSTENWVWVNATLLLCVLIVDLVTLIMRLLFS